MIISSIDAVAVIYRRIPVAIYRDSGEHVPARAVLVKRHIVYLVVGEIRKSVETGGDCLRQSCRFRLYGRPERKRYRQRLAVNQAIRIRASNGIHLSLIIKHESRLRVIIRVA